MEKEKSWLLGDSPPPTLPNKCYVLAIGSSSANMELDLVKNLVNSLTKMLSERPKAVLMFLGASSDPPKFVDASITSPWLFVSGSQASLTCPGCGESHRLLLTPATPGGRRKKTVCCHSLRNRPLRVTHNNVKNYFSMSGENVMDLRTYEAFILNTFIEKFNNKPVVFLNARYKWGAKNKTTGVWNGVVGNVST